MPASNGESKCKATRQYDVSSSTVAVYPINDIAIFLARKTDKSIAAVKKMIRRIGIVRAFDIAVKKGFLPR
jgi:hypothetical protein